MRKSPDLRTEHLNSEERNSIERVCIDFMDIFHLEGDKLPCTHTTSIEHEIKTPEGEPPIYQRQYRLPHRQRDEITRQIKQMKSDGIIEPSNSPWNSPILLVPKKMDVSGKPKFRLVVDFRKLNNITVGDKMPLPQIQDVLDRLGRSKYFSVLGLAQGFHQISLDKESRVKTAFSSDIGHWQYTKLPMGLKNSPPTFQRLMNNVLCNLIGFKCLVYLDDIIVFSTDLSEHDKRIREVFSRLRTHNLKLQPIKCEFLRKEVIYLGHKLTEKGVQPDERKIKSVKTFPIPTTVKEIKSFLGLTGYYRNFVPDYGKIAKPITNLLRKGIEFIWTSECQEAFEKLKIILCNEPLLQYPDFEKPFIITCDASNYAVGCVLSQGVIPADLPIAYASRTLNKAEINYSTTEKELVAIMFGVKQFRPYVYGQKFTIITDHKPLTWLFSVKDPGSRLLRWRIKLDEFDYEIQYKSEDHTANTMAKAFVTNFVCIHGIPMSILTDNGPEFVGEIFTEVCKILKIKKMMSSVYRPQTNGGLERAHKVIKEMLRHTIDNHAQNWCEHLPFVTFAYNSAVHKSTNFQPYELLYGNPVELPSPLQRRTEPCYTYDNYEYEMKQKMQNAYGLARELLIKTKHKTKEYYDREQNEQNIHVGDKVLILDHTRKHKLTPIWVGPYPVIKVLEYNIKIQKEKRIATLHKNHVKLFKE
ncbi:hypothetical protein QTP88_011216 [Uroleucon formosanum]